jgi:archaemetzincin
VTQDSSAITSMQPCCPYIDISSKKTSGYIAIAIGMSILVSGIFLVLAAYNNILPNSVNVISSLGYTAVIVGSLVTAYGLWKAFSHKDLHKSVINIDITPRANSWKRGIGKNEVEQTFEAFETSKAMRANARRNVLNIVIIDKGISKEEREILQIVSDYLKVVHGVTVALTTNYTLTDENRRGNQYAVESNISQIITNLPENAFVLGFTSEDLYPYEYRDSINFIFGVGLWENAAGLFSTCRIKSQSFETTLIRLMRLASHEFGHMRGLDHCTNYACCMQGVNSMGEADEVPLTFCALDMTKICRLNGWSLKEGYQRQLDFFEGFREKYRKKADFSREIQNLKRKIQAL